jgi:hypothetical protein
MSTSYNVLVGGNINPIDLVRSIAKNYGGSDFNIRVDLADEGHYIINFKEEFTPEEMKLNIIERSKVARHRQMHVYINGSCKCDYIDVTANDMTYISLGRSGDCEEILLPLVKLFGGYVKDEGLSHDTPYVRV